MWALTNTSKYNFVSWGKQEFLLKELRHLFGASVLAASHSLKITGSWLHELWVWGSKFTSYTHTAISGVEIKVYAEEGRGQSVDVHLFFPTPDLKKSVLAQRPFIKWLNFQQTEETRPCWVTSDDILASKNQQSCNPEEISGGNYWFWCFLRDYRKKHFVTMINKETK